MQDQFDKLPINDKRIFLLNNILNDEYFKAIHQTIKTNYSGEYNEYLKVDKEITHLIIRYLGPLV